MPLVTCPSCGHEQVAPREMTGLEVPCQRCGRPVRADDAARPKKPRPAAPREPIDYKTILKSVGLVAGLVVGVGVVMALIIWAIRTPAATAPPTAKENARAAARRANAEREQQREQAEKERRQVEETSNRITNVSLAGMGLAALLLILLGIILYVILILAVGAWVAYDANRRGMSGLGWSSFYYLFHVIPRLPVLPLAIIPSLLLPGVGLLFFLPVEPVAWTGLFVYLVARRPGRFTRCPHCGNRRLHYLVACPVCGFQERTRR